MVPGAQRIPQDAPGGQLRVQHIVLPEQPALDLVRIDGLAPAGVRPAHAHIRSIPPSGQDPSTPPTPSSATATAVTATATNTNTITTTADNNARRSPNPRLEQVPRADHRDGGRRPGDPHLRHPESGGRAGGAPPGPRVRGAQAGVESACGGYSGQCELRHDGEVVDGWVDYAVATTTTTTTTNGRSRRDGRAGQGGGAAGRDESPYGVRDGRGLVSFWGRGLGCYGGVG